MLCSSRIKPHILNMKLHYQINMTNGTNYEKISNDKGIRAVGSALIILKQGEETKYVLVKTAEDELWGLPGGKINLFEEPDLAVIREAREESGLEIILDGLVGVYSFVSEKGNPVMALVYEAHAVEGKLSSGIEKEILDAKAFSLGEVRQMHEAKPCKLRGGYFSRKVVEDYARRQAFPFEVVSYFLLDKLIESDDSQNL